MDGAPPLRIVGLNTPVSRLDWQSVFESDPDAMPSQSPEWADALTSTGKWRIASRMFVTPGKRRIVLPLVRVGLPGLAGEMSMARHWGYGGLLAEGGVTAEDVALVASNLTLPGLAYFRIRPNPLQAHLWREVAPNLRRVESMSQLIDLRGGVDAVKSRFGSSAWTGIKRAMKAGVRVETACGGKLLPEFFALAYKERREWAVRQNEPQWLAQIRYGMYESESKWRRIARYMGDRLRVTIAWHGDKPAAAGVVVMNGNAHGMRAAMDPEIRKVGASHLLNMVVLEEACAAGARWMNLGESATPGGSDFKSSFGAEAVTALELSFERLPFSKSAILARETVKKVIGFRPVVRGEGKP